MRTLVADALRSMRAVMARTVGSRRLQALAARGRAPIPVLFYHRICDHTPNAWTMCRQSFEAQIDLLRRSFDVIGLDEVQRRIGQVDSRRAAAAITFDDGYADNNDFALPLLVRHRLPCTYFVSVDHVRNGTAFPHDVEAGRPLAANTVEDLRHWAGEGVEIGLHTRSHFDFSVADDPSTIAREVVSAHEELCDLISRRIRYFAFPYGLPPQLRPAVMRAVQDAGMLGFCSAYGAYNLPGRDPRHIRRIHGDPEFARFVNWMYFDRRKLAREPVVPDLEAAPA